MKKFSFELLDEAVNKVLKRGRFLVICGEWNIKLLHDSTHQKALLRFLLSNHLQNTVSCPTRVTTNSSSLIDVMIRNKIFCHTSTRVVELGYSDHFALVMNIVVKRPLASSEKVVKRFFLKSSTDIFNCQLKTELWNDVHLQTDVNGAYSSFLTKYLKHFLHTFPLQQVSNKKSNKSGRIMQGIKVSRQRLQLLHLLERKISLSDQTLNYIKKYQRTYLINLMPFL
jgi:hypothetical protein